MLFWTRNDLKKALWWKNRFTKKDCPFCRDIIKNAERIIWKWKYWAILYNLYPYIQWWKHIMLIPLNHHQYTHDISSEEYSELNEAQKYIKNFYNKDWYFSFTRESMNERSVEHIHIHYLPGKLKRATIAKMLLEQGYLWFEE